MYCARIDPRLSLDEVEVQVQIETRGPEHLAAVLERLASNGYLRIVLDG